MAMAHTGQEAPEGNRRQIVPPSVAIARVDLDAPYDWLQKGWEDLWHAPAIGLTIGFTFALVALGMLAGLLQAGMQSLILVLAGGFLLVGPMLAVGLYETSRRLEAREPVSLVAALTAGFKAPGQLGFMGAILMFVYFIWLELAFLLFMLFMGARGMPPIAEFLSVLLLTGPGVALLVTGTIVGAALAAVVFAISAVSVPLMLTQRLDAVSAMAASVSAVRLNPGPMALWAALIAAIIAVGLATCLLGLIVAFPLIGHATWHAKEALVIERA